VRRVFIATELECQFKVICVKVIPVLHSAVHLVPEMKEMESLSAI
jgi:hypothetical protein